MQLILKNKLKDGVEKKKEALFNEDWDEIVKLSNYKK